MSIKADWVRMIEEMQDKICAALEAVETGAKFKEDTWQRIGGGGGRTRIIANGKVFEKGGVNISTVFGQVTESMRKQLKIEGEQWFACGLSLVIHPFNPHIPTIHCNYRMFELYDNEGNITDNWFGGGTDLTPFYLDVNDARHFHETYKKVCDKYDTAFYAEMKETCDNYFVNSHRNNERRGIGGIFYDHKRPSNDKNANFWLRFAKDCGDAFITSYIPIVEKHKGQEFTQQQKYWQEIRRGRYTEFNLVHDRGTIFGLKTNGRTESILMSLPPTVRFDYDFVPEPGSKEAELLDACLHVRNWV